jgi:hypothetical protein
MEDLQVHVKNSRHPPELRCSVPNCTFKKLKETCYCRQHGRNPNSTTHLESEKVKQTLHLYNYKNIDYIVDDANQIIHPQDYLKKQSVNYQQEQSYEEEGMEKKTITLRVIGRFHPELPENQRYEIFPDYLTSVSASASVSVY